MIFNSAARWSSQCPRSIINKVFIFVNFLYFMHELLFFLLCGEKILEEEMHTHHVKFPFSQIIPWAHQSGASHKGNPTHLIIPAFHTAVTHLTSSLCLHTLCFFLYRLTLFFACHLGGDVNQ